jgi:chromosome segregation ATPase
LKSYQESVATAERYLAKLQQRIQEKTAELESVSTDDDLQSQQAAIQRQLADLETKHKEEIDQITADHEAELESLRRNFAQTLEESRTWSERHEEIALQEKVDELNQLKMEAREAKRQLNELTFVKRSGRSDDIQQRTNVEEISRLEEQISELTALTREEIRDARAKIEECVAAVELRRRSYADELGRLEREATERNERYQEHLAVLKQQYDLERATIEQQTQATEARATNTEKIIEKLERHHETQLKEVLGDMETMRRSFRSPSKRSQRGAESMRALVRESQRLNEECRGAEQEIRVIDQEIEELENENQDLKRESERLARLLNENSQ